MLVKHLGIDVSPFDILLYRWAYCRCLPPFKNCFMIFFTYYITMMLSKQSPPQILICFIHMYTTLHYFPNHIPSSPKYRNPNIRFATKSEVQGPMRAKVCLGVKHTLTNEGECKGWSPMTPKCTPTLGVAFVWELRMFKTLVGRVNKH